jgi:hypothetical protein
VSVVFSANGRQLISGGADSTVLVWDATSGARASPPIVKALRVDELDELWTRLGGDAASAGVAIERLTQAPTQSIPLLRTRVRPVDPGRVEVALKNLDSDDFEVRERATEELATLGQSAERTLRLALVGKVAAEKRRRLNELLAKLDTHEPAAEVLRALRAVEVLENIGSAESRKWIEALAAGSKDFELTIHAKEAMRRVGR